MEAYWLQEGPVSLPEEWKKNGQLICELAIGGAKLWWNATMHWQLLFQVPGLNVWTQFFYIRGFIDS